jgi:hypothetical protein
MKSWADHKVRRGYHTALNKVEGLTHSGLQQRLLLLLGLGLICYIGYLRYFTQELGRLEEEQAVVEQLKQHVVSKPSRKGKVQDRSEIINQVSEEYTDCITYPMSRHEDILSIRLLCRSKLGRSELLLRCSTISGLNYGHRLCHSQA